MNSTGWQPLHPWFGRELAFPTVRQTWSEDRVFFPGEDGRQQSPPAGSLRR